MSKSFHFLRNYLDEILLKKQLFEIGKEDNILGYELYLVNAEVYGHNASLLGMRCTEI